MEYKELDKLAYDICSKLETPPAITASNARKEKRNFQWASCVGYESPKGWWLAEIGTDHEGTDDDNVKWQPLQGIAEAIEPAWRLIEDMKDRGWLISLNQCADGWVATGRYYVVSGGDWQNAGLNSDIVQEVGDTAPEAICRASLEALK